MGSLLNRLFGRDDAKDIEPEDVEAAIANGELVPYQGDANDESQVLVARDDDRRIILRAAKDQYWDQPDVLRRLAVQCLISEYCPEATQICRRIVGLRPDDEDAQVHLGASLIGQQDFAEAERVLNAHLARCPDSSYGYANLAKVYYQTGREAEAAEVVRRACECDPNNTNALNMHYFELLDEGGEEALVAGMLALAEASPDAWGPYRTLAQHFERVHDIRQGVLYLRKALDRGPNEPELLYYASGCLGESGLLDELIETLESARQHGDVPAEALYNLARAHLDVGNRRAARQVLEELDCLVGPQWDGLLRQLEREL